MTDRRAVSSASRARSAGSVSTASNGSSDARLSGVPRQLAGDVLHPLEERRERPEVGGVGQLRQHLQLAARVQRPDLVERLVRHGAHVADVESARFEQVPEPVEQKRGLAVARAGGGLSVPVPCVGEAPQRADRHARPLETRERREVDQDPEQTLRLASDAEGIA